MYKMTSHERFSRMFAHKEADRVPIADETWNATLERWRQEGMPAGVDYCDYFDIDKIAGIWVDNSPRYEYKVIEETEEYIIYVSNWGATLKQTKHIASVPDFLDFTITDAKSWAEAKARMTPTEDRVDWNHLKTHYKSWKENGQWIQANFWFGFDVSHSWAVGTETFLMAMMTDPDWCVDMFNTYLDMDIALFEQILDAGYTFDSIRWPDDMGYKLNQFFSINTYRELLKPVHKRAVDWAHSKGVKAHLHSCGDINPFIPELLEIGIDAINPLEVKAGMKPTELKKKYGDQVVFHGGINAVLWDDLDAILAEISQTLPVMKENGGYIFSSDHSIPSSVSAENFKAIIAHVKELGKY